MARRKEAKPAKTASARSQAAIFNELGPEHFAGPDADKKNVGSAKPTRETGADGAESDEELNLEAKFPLSLLYELQDLLNNHLTVAKGVQLLVCLYLGQIFYIYVQKEHGSEVLSAVGFNVLSALVAMYLSHRSLLKRHLAAPERTPYPELPSFNSLYAFFIPYAFVLLMADPRDPLFQVNLSMTNFSLRNLHPVAKILSSFVYNYMFSEANTVDIFRFGQTVWIYFTVEYALTLWNEDTQIASDGSSLIRRTMDPTEIHLVAIFLVNLLANYTVPASESASNVPMVLVRILSVALVGAFAVTTPVYYGYRQLAPGPVRALGSGLVVAVFAATFYVVTNHLFQLLVAPQEPVHWLIGFITASSLRVQLLQSWVLALVLTVPVVVYMSYQNMLAINERRKIWHFLLVAAVAYPALTHEPTFTAIAVMGAVFVFVALECLRCTRVTFLGDVLNSLLHLFQDDKDLSGPLSLSYIFLLVGVAIPIGYGVLVDDVVSIRSYLGLVALGMGDLLASIVGKRFGRTKWPGEARSIEGTATYVVATFATFVVVDYYLLPANARVQNWENLFIVALVGGAIEGLASLNDNVLIPCMTLIAYEVLNKVF